MKDHTATSQALPLTTAPEVNDFTERMGLGRFGAAVTSFSGRNDNWAGRTSTGAQVFVKILGGEPGDVQRRIGRNAAFYDTLSRDGQAAALAAPAYLGCDREHRITAFEFITDHRSGLELAERSEFSREHGMNAGRAVGELHSLDPSILIEAEKDSPNPADADIFVGVSNYQFQQFSMAQLDTIRTLQQDQALTNALKSEGRPAVDQGVPSHADLRLDQFLLTEHSVALVDWEEFRIGDPAFDVGSFAGEWLYLAILEKIKAVAARTDHRVSTPPNIVLSPDWPYLARLRPIVTDFWLGYRQTREIRDPDFARRATRFAGIHLIERLLGNLARKPRPGMTEFVLLRVARTIIVSPDRFVTTVGFGNSE